MFPVAYAVSMQRRRIAIATVLTLVAGAAAVVSFNLGVFSSDDSVSDKPRPPMIILTRSPQNDDGEGGE
jgi:hypothetical protein